MIAPVVVSLGVTVVPSSVVSKAGVADVDVVVESVGVIEPVCVVVDWVVTVVSIIVE